MSIAGLKLGLPEDIESDAEEVRGGAEQLYELRNTMLGHTGELDGTLQSTATEFAGAVAWDISDASQTDIQSWQDLAELLTGTGLALGFYADAVETYKEVREDLERRWEEHKAAALLRIEEADGMLTAAGTSAETAEMTHALTVRAGLLKEHDTAREEFNEEKERTEKVLTNSPDQALWERAVDRGLISGRDVHLLGGEIPAEIEFGPAEDWTPQEVADWWRDLAPHQQEWAMEDYPELLRDLDGIPVVVRDQLNRDHLDDEIARLEEEIEALEQDRQEALDALASDGSDEDVDIPTTNPADLEEELDTLIELRNDLNDEDADRYLLALDTENRGRAIVSTGNPDTADNVATLVPGTTTTWQSIDEQMNRAEALRQSAVAADEDGEHAVISWIGYDAPNVAEAAFPGRAEGAVDELSSFQDGLRATHENTTASHNTVIGHSYGSTVVGHTAQSEAGLNADEIVLVGSPGADADHVSELGFAPENVHASTAGNDKITDFTGLTHGADPTSPDFGASVFTSDKGSQGGNWPLGDAHSEYFNRGTASLEHMGEVIAGKH
ncbi:alpha/beta hydrolase [Nocardiopsis lambiniae]|uniref:Alpha/beta hydrolase n=1 Tax=Nocardiopsis lambiniae TaxID=3075539 RepID=A0ABU2MFV3_9ACTN|nr:alpha/beta hydrolase [Nocardiopsis sp. DSM 44743]MDT0331452.1 alpha/beta hydrolase [Nocardiopsis sp. DSM 44743]